MGRIDKMIFILNYISDESFIFHMLWWITNLFGEDILIQNVRNYCLFLEYAFEEKKIIRVEFKTDERNICSNTAIS